MRRKTYLKGGIIKMQNDVVIKNVSEQDLPQIVSLHKKIFHGYLSTSLGDNLIYQYYKAYYCDKDSVFLMAKKNDSIVGFVLLTSKYRQILSTFYKENIVNLSFKIMWEMVKLNSVVLVAAQKRILNALKNRKEINEGIKASLHNETKVSLLSIAVDSAFRGSNLATQFISSLEMILKDRKIDKYKLSVNADNERAKNFYNKMGFTQYDCINNKAYYVKKIV
jgi:ribosomal protein S18 acetylase RimI-like enzyme